MKTKIWLITGASLILLGCIIFAGVMTMLKWDFTKLSTTKYETNTYEIAESYENITIITDTARIEFVLSENENTSVVCYEEKNLKHSVEVKDGTLAVEIDHTKKWYENIGINFGSPKITVYLPEGEYGKLTIKESTGDMEIPKKFSFESIDVSTSTGDIKNYASAKDFLKIKTSTGDICIENVSAGALELSVTTGAVNASSITCGGDVSVTVSTGKAFLTDVSCKNLSSSGSTGDLTLKNVIATEIFSLTRSTGDVSLDRCDASEIFVTTDTGKVTGTLLSDKIFFAQTDTGRVDVPKTTAGGKCEITTDTGNIKISIEK